MGYREYLYEMDKTFVDDIRKCKTEEDYISLCRKFNIEVDEEDDDDYCYVPVYRLGKEIYEFGRDYENSDELYKHGNSLFSSEKLNESYKDYGAIILEKSGLICAIEWQRDKIIKIYEDLLRETSINEFDKRSQFDRMKEHIEYYLKWWKPFYSNSSAYNLDENSDKIVKSYLYEHSIFDLVRIYKSFDWENKCLIFLGY